MRAKLAHNDEITCYALSHSARSLTTGSKDHSIKVWNLERAMLTQVCK